jgi:sodium/hydrogen antiporter
VAGLVVQVGFKEAGKDSVQFAEEWGQLLNLSVFFLFGVLVARAGHRFTVAHLLYAILSLTLVRMLPVTIALLGARLQKATVLFMGWFGPRGLASIVLGLVYLEHKMPLPGESTISLAVMATGSLSIFAHGLSAVPGISLYAKHVAALDASAPEQQGAEVKLAGEDLHVTPHTSSYPSMKALSCQWSYLGNMIAEWEMKAMSKALASPQWEIFIP